jgi:tetratricopeptide (TPR) repeat protein
MRSLVAGALRNIAVIVFGLYGAAVQAQNPVTMDPNDPGSGEPISTRSLPPFNYSGPPFPGMPSQGQQSSAQSEGIWFPQRTPNESNAPITVAELQHPLSGKGRKLILKAQAELRDGKPDDCLADLDQAERIASAVPYAHGVRGAAYLLEGRFGDAISQLQEAVQVLPLPANYSNLGYAYLLTGDLDRGEEQLRRAVELHNSPPQARYLMGLLLLDRKPQNREACEDLQQAQNLMPVAHMALAVCYERDGKDAAADGQIHQVLGSANAPRFGFWKKWVSLVAAEPRPSIAFGLRAKRQPVQ